MLGNTNCLLICYNIVTDIKCQYAKFISPLNEVVNIFGLIKIQIGDRY